jgi:rifampicin phosphotransferase
MALSEREIAAAFTGDASLRPVAAARMLHARAAEADGAPVMLGHDEGPPPDPQLFPPAMAELLAAILVSFEIEDAFVSFHDEASTWTGHGVGIGAAPYTGRACVAATPEDGLERLQPGDVLVTTHTTPAYEAVMAVAGAVVTESGGLVSHAAVVCREQDIPAVLGVSAATSTIPDGATVTVDPTTGHVTVTTP